MLPAPISAGANADDLEGRANHLEKMFGALRTAASVQPRTGWPKNPRALAGHLRRAQTFLRTLGIDITFSREGRSGTRALENTVSSVSDGGPEPGLEPQPWGPPSPVSNESDQLGSRAALCPVRRQTMLTVLTQKPAFLAPSTRSRS
jgi:hypothetical protein